VSASLGAVGPRLEARHQQEVEHLDRPVFVCDADRPTRGRNGDEFRMRNGQRTPVREMNIERPERLCSQHSAEFFDSHSAIIAVCSGITPLFKRIGSLEILNIDPKL
jgi:hypothetical protein